MERHVSARNWTLFAAVREMKRAYNDFGFELTMGAHILESNSSGNLTPAVSEAGTVLPGYLAVILSVLMVTLVVVVVAGNALVIMAFIVDKTLRNQSNYFFLNLAISDFLVGELVPLQYTITLQYIFSASLLFIEGFMVTLLSFCFIHALRHHGVGYCV